MPAPNLASNLALALCLVIFDRADGIGIHRDQPVGGELQVDHRHDQAFVSGPFDHDLNLASLLEHGDRVGAVKADDGHAPKLTERRCDGNVQFGGQFGEAQLAALKGGMPDQIGRLGTAVQRSLGDRGPGFLRRKESATGF